MLTAASLKGKEIIIKPTFTAVTVILCSLLLGACGTTKPISTASAKAVISQNETTEKHIKSFTEANKRTQAHVQKIQDQAKKIKEEAGKESDAMDQVIKDARVLLGKP